MAWRGAARAERRQPGECRDHCPRIGRGGVRPLQRRIGTGRADCTDCRPRTSLARGPATLPRRGGRTTRTVRPAVAADSPRRHRNCHHDRDCRRHAGSIGPHAGHPRHRNHRHSGGDRRHALRWPDGAQSRSRDQQRRLVGRSPAHVRLGDCRDRVAQRHGTRGGVRGGAVRERAAAHPQLARRVRRDHAALAATILAHVAAPGDAVLPRRHSRHGARPHRHGGGWFGVRSGGGGRVRRGHRARRSSRHPD